MLTRTIGPITVTEAEKKETIRVEIDFLSSPPSFRAIRRQATFKDDAISEISTYPVDAFTKDSAKVVFKKDDGSTVTLDDILAFVDAIVDTIDGLEGADAQGKKGGGTIQPSADVAQVVI